MVLAETQVPFVPWEEFYPRWQWRQGDHVTLIGPTDSGKTTLLTHILNRRDYIIFLGTKRKDSTQTALVQRMGFKQISSIEEAHQDVHKRYLLKPPFPKDATVAQLKKLHANVFRKALMRAFRQGGWTIVADEIRYVTGYLGLSDEYELLMLQGRSLDVTMVGGTQRPRHVPLESYSQAKHLFLWNNPDLGDIARVAELAGVNADAVENAVTALEGHNVLYVKLPKGEMLTTVTPPPNQKG